MFSRILLGALSVVAGGIFVAAAAAAGSDGDPSAAASAPLPELAVAPPTDYPDVRISNEGGGQAAFNPADPKRLVVGIVSGTGCYIKRSADGGKTWGALVQLPQLAGAYCWYSPAPTVTYAADGGRLYAAYSYYERPFLNGVAFSVSTDQGATWSTPINALPERGLGDDDGYSDVRLAAAPDGRWLYVAANWRGYHATQTLLFSSSGNQGSSWSPDKKIAASYPADTGITYLRGFALASGRGGNVMVAYGWQESVHYPSYDYSVQVARSADRGGSFLYGTADQYSSADPYLLIQPDIEIGPSGTAHLVYAKGGEAILYKYSYPPYSSWSAVPVRLNDDVPQANLGAPQLAVGTCARASILHATWRESLTGRGKILYTRKVAQPGYVWSRPLNVGKLNRLRSDGSLAAIGAKAFSIWQTGPDSDNTAVFGSRVSSGVTCP